jgi:hypothetical protein
MSLFSKRIRRKSHVKTSSLSLLWRKRLKKLPNLRRILLPLTILLLIFVVFGTWQAVRNSVWDGNSQLTIAFEQNDQLGYIRVNKEHKEVKVFLFPVETLIPLSYGYQEYRSDKVKLLAKQENINFGELISSSMTQFLGSITDGYIVKAKGDPGKPSLLVAQSLYRKASTDFTNWDLLRLLYFFYEHKK